jgi:NhaP-type Na+/H+ or K+/H+ antiporter
MLPLLVLTSAHPTKEYFLSALLQETILGMVGGFALGTILRIAWDFAKSREWVDKESRLVWTLAMAIFTVGLVSAKWMLS